MARSGTNFAEGVQFRRPLRAKEPVPRLGPKAHDAGEARFQIAKFHRAQQRSEVSAERPHGRPIVEPGVKCHNQEDGGTGERRVYWLRNGRQGASGFGRSHWIGLHLDIIWQGARALANYRGAFAQAVDKVNIVCRQTSRRFLGYVLSGLSFSASSSMRMCGCL